MNTTDLFVELIVIGAGAAIWLTLLILSIFGYAWVPWKEISSIVTLIPFLAITYVLGLIMDRLSDRLYSTWDKELRRRVFSSNEEYHSARTFVYTYAADKIIDLFEYGRGRLRISRGWSINCLFLTINIPIFVWTRFPRAEFSMRLAISSILIFGLGATATLATWKKLAINDYKRLAETNTFLKNERAELIATQSYPK